MAENIYKLCGEEECGYCLQDTEKTSFIPVDIRNRDFYEYSEKVRKGEAEDVLPEGVLDEERAKL